MEVKERKISMVEACFPLVILMALIYFGNVRHGIKTQPLMLLASAITFFIARFRGVTWADVSKEVQKKFGKAIPALLIVVSVGFVLSTWIASGTIPMMIYYGVRLVSPKFLIVTAFITCAIVSVVTGTSYGSAATMGVTVIGVAIALGVNPAIVAGAVVSGAYFGDKMSPLSDTTNLSPAVAGSDVYEHIAHMFYTTIPATVICLIVYTLLGFTGAAGTGEADLTVADAIGEAFNMNPLLLLPLVIVLVGSVKRFATLPVMGVASLVAGIEAVVFQHISVKNILDSMMTGFTLDMITMPGFQAEEAPAIMKTLLVRGGMVSIMSNAMLIVFAAYVFASVLTAAGYLDTILDKLLSVVKTTGSLITSTAASCWLTAFVTGSGTLAIVLPGELFEKIYPKMGLAPKNLSRTLEDSGTVVMPLIPWSSAGAYMSTTLGVATLAYAPWAILCYSCTIIAIIIANLGIGIAKIEPAE